MIFKETAKKEAKRIDKNTAVWYNTCKGDEGKSTRIKAFDQRGKSWAESFLGAPGEDRSRATARESPCGIKAGVMSRVKGDL